MSARAEYREFQRQVAGRLAGARGEVSQNRLAKELGYSQQMISRYESGRIPKCFLYLARLSERRNVDVNWVLAGLGERLQQGNGETAAADVVDGGAPLAGELTPELYESFEPEAVLALLRLWTDAAPPVRASLTDRLRAVIVWWKVQAPELSAPLSALSEALEGDGTGILPAVTAIAEHFRSHDDVESLRRGIRLYRYLLSEFQRTDAPVDVATALIRLGQMCRKTAQWSKAKEFYMAGVRAAESLENPILLEEGWAGLGNLAADLTDYVSARTYFRQELAAAMRTRDPRLRIRTYVSLSLVAAESSQNVAEGLDYAQAGLALCDESGDAEFRCELLINKGVLLATQGRRDEARAAYAEAVSLAQGPKEGHVKATACHDLAELALADGAVEEAEEFLEEAERWCGEAELPGVRSSILLNRARAALRRGRLRDAARTSRQAFLLAEKHGIGTLVAQSQTLSAEIEEGIPLKIAVA